MSEVISEPQENAPGPDGFPMVTRAEALEFFLSLYGLEIITEGGPFHLTNGWLSPVAVRLKDPVPALQAAVNHLKKKA